MPANHKPNNLIRIIKAMLTNQLARFAPNAYVRLTQETGRGLALETPEMAVDYFYSCFDDYFERLNIPKSNISAFLKGRCLLEYGPGDLPGVALLMFAHGAQKVFCVDRFHLWQNSSKNIETMRLLIARLPEPERQRAWSCFNRQGSPESGLKPECINYKVDPSGLSGLNDCIDLVYSRAVLEHVSDIQAVFRDMQAALVPGGLGLHKVDLKSHGMHQQNPLDFLIWPDWLWHCLYSHKGVPNRKRLDAYQRVLAELGLDVLEWRVTENIDQSLIDQVRPFLAKPFQSASDEVLSCLGFWLVFTKPERSA